MESQKITINIPQQLVAQIDGAARAHLCSRSVMIRIALQFYCAKKHIPLPGEPPQQQDDFSDIIAKHPTVDPNDVALLQFFRDIEKKGYNS